MVLPYNLNRFGGGKRRPYYCEVEYIETPATSTNVSAFTTNMFPRAGTSITMEIMPTAVANVRRLTGATGTQGNGWGATFIEITQTGYWGLGNTASDVAASTARRDKIKIEFATKTHKLYVNDVLKITYTLNTPHTTDPYGWSLGCITSSTSLRMPAKWYRAYQEDENGNIIHDIIPVLDWDMTPCFYDKVTGQLFYKTQIVGSGNVSYGRQIHYVEYLESTGTQYIKTKLLTSLGLKAHSVFEFTENYSYGTPFCTQSPAGNYYGLRLKHTYLTFQALSGSSLTDCGSVALNTKYTVDFTVTADTMTAVINGTTYTNSSITFNPTGTADIWMFASNAGGSPANYLKGKIYETQYYNVSGSLLGDFRPAVDENGVGFMFDQVTHSISDNAGTGVFSYPDVELEYIQSSTSGDYIDLDVYSDWTKDIKVKGAFLTTTASNRILLIGNYQGASYDFNIEVMNSKFRVWSQGDINKSTTTSVSANVKIDYEFSYDSVSKNYALTSDYGSISGTKPGGFDISTYKERIFYDNRSQTGTFKTYKMYFLDYKNGTADLKIRPVIHNGVFCVYDEVSETYPTISGTFTGKIKEKR